jgi:peptide/nickel transport system substrate-binding protein
VRHPWESARWSAASLVLISGILAVACAPSAGAPTAAPRPAESKPAEAAKPAASPVAESAKPAAAPAKLEPQGSIVLAMPDEPPILEIWAGSATYGIPVLRNVGEALLNRDPTTNELIGELATKWERTDDKTWRFTLRQGVKFHDDSPFNAESAAFSLNHTWSKENNFRIRQFIGPELQAKAVDEFTLDVTTEAPDPILPSRLYFAPISSMKQLKEKPDTYVSTPIGTGPYKFVEWVKGQHIKLTANPDWWGNSATDAHGAITIKDASFVLRPEREVRTAMTQRGEADLARWVTQEQCKSAPQCSSGPGIETAFIRLDLDNPALKDRRVREAIALAIDKNALINDILGGGTVARQLVGPSAVGYNPELQPFPYDPERAKQLVAEARAAGVPVDTPLTNYARRGYLTHIEEAAEAVTEWLHQVGFTNVTTRLLETAAFTEMWGAPKPIPPERGMIGTNGHGNEIMDFSTTVNTYYTCAGRLSVMCDPKLDEMHSKALPLTGEARVKAYQEIAKYANDQVYAIPVGQPTFYYALSARVNWKSRLDGLILLKEMTLKQ